MQPFKLLVAVSQKRSALFRDSRAGHLVAFYICLYTTLNNLTDLYTIQEKTYIVAANSALRCFTPSKLLVPKNPTPERIPYEQSR